MPNRNAAWLAPATVVAIAGLVVSLMGNVWQYRSVGERLAFEKTRWQDERARLEDERAKLREELDQMRAIRALSSEERTRIESELADIARQLAFVEEARFGAVLERQKAANRLAATNDGGRPAFQQVVANVEGLITECDREIDKLEQRRKELEARLGLS